jgi:tetratricopeptide (TPR) repeat protein
MALFGMRYLLDFDRIPQGCEAAKELGRSGDPEAFLVLLDVFQDEAAPDPVRQAAGEALTQMSRHSRKLPEVIKKAKSAGERGDHGELIRILTERFERDGAGYVQSAYLIGRAYLRLDHVADANEWFRVAERRNRKAALYGGRIRTLIDESNRRLFAIGDEHFASGDYQTARERYAAASHGLSTDESRRNSAFVRLACAYCMLGDYRDAEQALLQALRHGQNTDSALALSQMLQQLMDRQSPPSKERHQELTAKIRDQASVEIRGLTDLGGSDG